MGNGAAGTRVWRGFLPAIAMLGWAVWSGPAAAQASDDNTVTPAGDAPCSAWTRNAGKDRPELRVGCAGTGFTLGPADGHALVYSEQLRATLVDATWRDQRRIWLIGTTADGALYLEDLGGAIARAGGRGARTDLAGLAIDLAQFSASGVVRVVPERDADPASGATGTLDVAALVQRASDRIGAAAGAGR